MLASYSTSGSRSKPTILFTVPVPPSLNNLFVNVRGKGRVPSKRYSAWREKAWWDIHVQRPGRIEGPVDVQIIIQDKGRFDLDNTLKAILDICVSSKLIDGDHRAIVRSINAKWGNVTGAQVRIERAA